MNSKSYDLEDRLVRFAGDIILFCKSIPKDEAGQILCKQLIRSAMSAALNYGEVQGAESRKDEIHKLSVVLKELKESRVSLRLCIYIDMGEAKSRHRLHDECEQLVAIIARIRINKRKS